MAFRSRVFVTMFVVALPVAVQSCATSGICGAAPYCQQPMMSVPMQCQCAPSYGCGQYGCYRLRAKASRNVVAAIDGDTSPSLTAMHRLRSGQQFESSERSAPLKELDERSLLAAVSPTAAELHRSSTIPTNPNEAFLNCCMDRQLPDACLRRCNFNFYNKEALTAMYFKQDACPLDAMKEMQFCAAQGRDHRQCCIRNGVTTTLAGAKCLVFCDQRPGMVTQLDLSYLSCLERFENMKSCFWHHITRFS